MSADAPAAARRSQSAPRRRPRLTGKAIAPYLFILPNMAIFGLFTIYPAFDMINISFYDSSDGRRFKAVGTENYAEIFSSAEFFSVALNTMLFTVAFVLLTVVASTALAVMLNDKFRGRDFFRAVIFLPTLLSAVVVGLLWGWILDRTNGLVNVMLDQIGLGQPGWLTDGNLTRWVIVAVGLWIHTGFYALIMLSGLQGIDPNVYEAAQIDGAGRWRTFTQMTWPLLRPTTLVVIILSMISGFQAFDFIWTLTGGGPVGATTLMVQFIYQKAFESPVRYGLASAGAVVLFIVVFAFTVLNFLYGRRKEAA
ncbi:carbohydrate ABC transporter permease [Propionibacteriaceae bacterium Y1685]|uniref:carbohydrate ABC transporter permease n=1 Tax=Microlunatus sp. Y1700 TaxID=3418487 RepID=UPI003B778CD7